MKRTISLVLISLMALAVAQEKGRLVFRDDKKNPSIILQGDRGYVDPGESFELSGNVSLQLVAQNLLLTCGKAGGKIVGTSKKSDIDDVRLTGGVKVTIDNKAFFVIVTGDSVDYDLQETARLIKLKGNASFNFKSKGDPASTLDAKSSNADITLSKNDNIVKTASMTGGITLNGVEIQKVSNGFKKVKFSVKAQSLLFTEKSSDEKEVRLEKNIVVTRSSDEGDADVTGAQVLVLTLNGNNEVTRSRFSSDGVGQVKTTLKKGND